MSAAEQELAASVAKLDELLTTDMITAEQHKARKDQLVQAQAAAPGLSFQETFCVVWMGFGGNKKRFFL